MKRILITGKDSYIGSSFEQWLKQYNKLYEVSVVDMMDPGWRHTDFSGYDVVFHVAGLAHSDTGKISKSKQAMYYKINCDLAVETADKAKKAGVKQFIYMSSIIVFGKSGSIREKRIIDKNTKPAPVNCYGNSKLQAENRLLPLSDKAFKVTILRPPMIYGKGCKGNYRLLAILALRSPLFPKIKNVRSFLYIDNLCECIRLVIDKGISGILYPQNSEYAETAQLVSLIAEAHGKKIWITSAINWIIFLMETIPGKIGSMIQKAFGSLAYDMELSGDVKAYEICSLRESIYNIEQMSKQGYKE